MRYLSGRRYKITYAQHYLLLRNFTWSTAKFLETKWFSNAKAISGFTFTLTNVKNTAIASLIISICGDIITCNNSLVGLVKNYKNKGHVKFYYNISSYTPNCCILVAYSLCFPQTLNFHLPHTFLQYI